MAFFNPITTTKARLKALLSCMKHQVKRSEIKGITYITKLRIDRRTVVMVRTKESLKSWKTKYPDAVEVA